jgi:hypothetical protein
VGDGVADLGVVHLLMLAATKPDLAGPELVEGHRERREHAELGDLVLALPVAIR